MAMEIGIEEFIKKIKEFRAEYQRQANTEADLVKVYRAQGALELADKILEFPEKEKDFREMEEDHYRESGGFPPFPQY